jgi:hypothetical protein
MQGNIMATNLSASLTFNDDVVLVPVGELPHDARTQIECDAGDFALSRTRSRAGSKILDAEAARLVERFREPRTLVEAVILFGREKGVDPGEVLEGAYPLIRSLVDGGFLVPAGAAATASGGDVAQASVTSAALPGTTRVRTLQVLDDTEVVLLHRAGAGYTVLKLARATADARAAAATQRRLQHEADYLEHLDGDVAPRLCGAGELAGCAYLEIEFVAGADLVQAAAEWRERAGDSARRALLRLCRATAAAYAALHERGVLHGDVHPRNVFVEASGAVRVIDFGVAAPRRAGTRLPQHPDRGGVPFFYEPELAIAARAGRVSPPPSEAGEQHAVASLLYFVVTGAYWQDFRLAREAMLDDLATRVPMTFRERGAAAWPQLEAVLMRALAKDPAARFPSMRAFASALAAIDEVPVEAPKVAGAADALAQVVATTIAHAQFDGAWSAAAFEPAPSTSLNYGSCGVALGVLHVALRRESSELLALADAWARRAERELGRDGAFHNPAIDITPAIVGECSPYHAPSGVQAVQALVAVAAGDPLAQGLALTRFLAAARAPAVGLDLTLGRASPLLGAAILFDALAAGRAVDTQPLRAFGDQVAGELWQALDGKPAIADADVDYLGIAHGWAGFVYATLQWCAVTGMPVPAGVARRLDEIDALTLPLGRGAEWPWLLRRSGEPATMAGWCNGTCGYVFLWTLAHRLSGNTRHRELAERAAWRTWEAAEPAVSLCCGLAGRAYALLNQYRSTRESVWLARARDLAQHAVLHGQHQPDYPHSLYKGAFGLAVLAADLERPEDARMPFFEPMGYQRG